MARDIPIVGSFCEREGIACGGVGFGEGADRFFLVPVASGFSLSGNLSKRLCSYMLEKTKAIIKDPLVLTLSACEHLSAAWLRCAKL